MNNLIDLKDLPTQIVSGLVVLLLVGLVGWFTGFFKRLRVKINLKLDKLSTWLTVRKKAKRIVRYLELQKEKTSRKGELRNGREKAGLKVEPTLEFSLKRIDDRRLRVVLRNTGKGLAKYPSFVTSLPNGIRISNYAPDGNTPNTFVHYQTSYKDKQGEFARFNGGINEVIHANGGELPVIDFKIDDSKAVKGKTIEFEYYLDAENMQTREGKYPITL